VRASARLAFSDLLTFGSPSYFKAVKISALALLKMV
jgi:hypothetical protein